MYNCPECKITLNKESSPAGIIWKCPTCSGKAISAHVLRKVIPDEILMKLWQKGKSGDYKVRRKCPVCDKAIPEVPIINRENTIHIDICATCHFIWFDGQEYESLPKFIKEQQKELTPKAKKALTQFQVKRTYKKDGNADESIWHDLLGSLDPVFEIVLFFIFE